MSSISLYKCKHFLKEAYYPSEGTLKTFDNQRKTQIPPFGSHNQEYRITTYQ